MELNPVKSIETSLDVDILSNDIIKMQIIENYDDSSNNKPTINDYELFWKAIADRQVSTVEYMLQKHSKYDLINIQHLSNVSIIYSILLSL